MSPRRKKGETLKVHQGTERKQQSLSDCRGGDLITGIICGLWEHESDWFQRSLFHK